MQVCLFIVFIHYLFQEPGSISWVKEVFSHSQADYANKNFYPNYDLANVTTDINLLSLLQLQTG